MTQQYHAHQKSAITKVVQYGSKNTNSNIKIFRNSLTTLLNKNKTISQPCLLVPISLSLNLI